MRIGVTGYPASGKTTFAKQLAQTLEFTYINIRDFAEQYNCVESYDAQRDVIVIDEEKVKQALQQHNNIVIDSHFAHIIPADKTIFIQCDKKLLKNRMVERGYTSQKIQENMDAMNFHVIEDELPPDHIVVDGTQPFDKENILKRIQKPV